MKISEWPLRENSVLCEELAGLFAPRRVRSPSSSALEALCRRAVITVVLRRRAISLILQFANFLWHVLMIGTPATRLLLRERGKSRHGE